MTFLCTVFRPIRVGLLLLFVFCVAMQAQAADRVKMEEFLKVTGFDVALDSIALSADLAPQMLGLPAEALDVEFELLAKRVFDKQKIRALALDILQETLENDLADHTIAFYGSGLGARLVQAENLSHFDDDDLKQLAGERIVATMVQEGDPKLQLLKRMNAAIDPTGQGTKAVLEIQVRFLLAAATSGVVDLKVDEGELRARISENEAEMRLSSQTSALKGAAYTYQGFTLQELEAYTVALEKEEMQKVYELMNGIHYEVMAQFFEKLAYGMKDMQPAQEL